MIYNAVILSKNAAQFLCRLNIAKKYRLLYNEITTNQIQQARKEYKNEYSHVC